MQVTKLLQNQTGLFVVILFAIAAILISNPNSDLEKRVTDLENRVAVLEEKLTESERVGSPEIRPTHRENWRKLSERMREDRVRELLGEPTRIHGGSTARWEYPMGGVVWFRNGRVSSWNEPYY
jgi:hypothetical protein